MSIQEDVNKLERYLLKLNEKYKGNFEKTYPLGFIQSEVEILKRRAKKFDSIKQNKVNEDGFK